MNQDGESFRDDFNNKIYQLNRDLNQRKHELESSKKISDLEVQRLKDIHQAQLEQQEGQVQEMNQKLAYYQDNLNSLTQQLDAAEQTKALDISQQQNQIQKLDQDLKQIAEKF